MGRWVKVEDRVQIVNWNKHLISIPYCDGFHFINQSPEDLEAFLAQSFRVYDAKQSRKWLGGEVK